MMFKKSEKYMNMCTLVVHGRLFRLLPYCQGDFCYLTILFFLSSSFTALFEPCPNGTLAEQEAHIVRSNLMLYRCGALGVYVDRLPAELGSVHLHARVCSAAHHPVFNPCRRLFFHRLLPDVQAQVTEEGPINHDPPPYTGDPMAVNARLRNLLALIYLLLESARAAKADPTTFAAEQETADSFLRDLRQFCIACFTFLTWS